MARTGSQVAQVTRLGFGIDGLRPDTSGRWYSRKDPARVSSPVASRGSQGDPPARLDRQAPRSGRRGGAPGDAIAAARKLAKEQP
ncbi:hypothetical protein GTS_24560 [Gandjariella thermophila]|uniref:Uncharacterized protein n=1 Tax=Gandjariella thermophila TaxID=1931992 RepID=A0A4D4JAH7_9PSEU|nr:hypothetical protein GTS_24560 [Gandjariella thermophila]